MGHSFSRWNWRIAWHRASWSPGCHLSFLEGNFVQSRRYMEAELQPGSSSFWLFSKFVLYSKRRCVWSSPSIERSTPRHGLIAAVDFELMLPFDSGIPMKVDTLCYLSIGARTFFETPQHRFVLFAWHTPLSLGQPSRQLVLEPCHL